ncbi:hypothetical protein WCX49_00905 [Sulfurimonas sp. HSL-1656]|uniref:hypothetical protein n=1 Tax=Thiomicrolovo subterrani TaxID=3131934 RepID=UPI0031F908A7
MQPTDTPTKEDEIGYASPDIVERYLGFKTKHFLLALAGVVLGAFYLSNLLFGNASLEVLLQLENYEGHLASEIARLKQENATLQKEYFELKELEPSE